MVRTPGYEMVVKIVHEWYEICYRLIGPCNVRAEKNVVAGNGAVNAGGDAGKPRHGASIPEYLLVGHGSGYRRAEEELSHSAGIPGSFSTMLNHRSGKETGGCADGLRRRPVFMEICCSSESVLVSALPHDIHGIRITERDDFTRRSTVDYCIKHIRSKRDVVWYSAPCTGGCPYQSINRTRGEAMRKHIGGHWVLMKRLWGSCETVAEHAIAKGATIVIEWSRRCQ